MADPGDRLGPYRILEKLGEGGFGEVYAAEQLEPIKRQVAVKVLKRGMDTKSVLARFEAERQALALMDHPNIAKILDAGETDGGRPYFVMDLIRGVPITDFCDQQRLDTRARVGLFVSVCEAVQHAHQKGVIHRDIKPSNVLVSTGDSPGTAKVIDFGIAKAMHSPLTELTVFTKHGQMIGTPAYMSPEQAAGGLGVDTTTDVYSLGAVLYQLLAGSVPFDQHQLGDAGAEGLPRLIREVEPPLPSDRVSRDSSREVADRRRTTPSELRGELRGELDWITMTAMEKDPGRRYPSADALAADLRRYLRHEPVEAVPPGAAYQAGKFVRRHRVGVAVAAAAVIVLVGFAATMAVQAKRIAVERDRANRERDGAERVAGFLAEMLGTVDPETLGNSLWDDLRARVRTAHEEGGSSEAETNAAVERMEAALEGVNSTEAALRLIDEEILARAGGTIESELADSPLIAARLRNTFGLTYSELGMYEQAEPYLRQAIERRTELLGPDHPETLDSRNQLTSLLEDTGRTEEAVAHARETLERCRNALGDDHPRTLGAVSLYAVALRLQGKTEESEPFYREAIAGCRRVLGERHSDTITAIGNLGWLLHEIGRHEEGEALTREAVALAQESLGMDNPVTLTSMSNFGTQLAQLGKLAEAEEHIRACAAAFERVQGRDHRRTLIALVNLGALLDQQNKPEEAEPVYRDVLARFRRVLGEEHPNTLGTMSNLGYLLKTLGKYDEADTMLANTLSASRRLFGESHIQTIIAQNSMGDLRVKQGRAPDAEPLLRDALAKSTEAFGPDDWTTGVVQRTYGLCLTALGRYPEAERNLVTAHGVLLETLGPDHRRPKETAADLAALYQAWGKPDEAEAWRGRS